MEECCKEEMPMQSSCRPKCERKCIGEFVEKFKVYEVCCREVMKVCSVCNFEYEMHRHHMCPRCNGYGHMEHGGYGHMGYGGYGHMGYSGYGHMGHGGYGQMGMGMGYGRNSRSK